MIHQSIKTQLIEAMRAKDAVRLDVIRSLLSAFSNELIAKGS
ncbi:MAG: GatB/YqeY domain-containing protein, partial [Candidatus Pacebacteria bacterium]|nr:GatB/YqeY domain-containing protein [Candidatus Paceibacterota bacterium]